MNIYVGSLDYKVKEKELEQIFSNFGTVSSVKIITDRITQRSKGFAFVEMPNDAEAKEAIDSLNGTVMGSRNVFVNESTSKK